MTHVRDYDVYQRDSHLVQCRINISGRSAHLEKAASSSRASTMPSVLAPAKALVTGSNGYVGTWLVHTLLEHGYSVRGTVRTTAKGDALKASLGLLATKFEYSIVDDVLKVCFSQRMNELLVVVRRLL